MLRDDCVYPIGFDPKWYMSTNGLTYMNSMKMKLAVILGVAQMCLGILMKGLNAIHFGSFIDFVFEFVPQIILMLCLFGYMDALIIVKWLMPWEGREGVAPSIISTMINMFLKFGEIPDDSQPLLKNALYQQMISNRLLALGLVCVPVMLLVKPLWFLYTTAGDKHSEKHFDHRVLLQEEDDGHEHIEMSERSNRGGAKEAHSESKDQEHKDKEAEDDKKPHHDHKAASARQQKESKKQVDEHRDLLSYIEETSHGAHDFSEVFIHQLIETIEFVLGTVSNTASYLRLWALSLAHSQLAAVFFEKLLGGLALEGNSGKGSAVLLFFLFPIFFTFTLFVLMCMDSMECFLHTLRLHWVEFQNKFYKGNGYRFVPFSFAPIYDMHMNE